MSKNFFAMTSRMKYINRWALMKNTKEESLSQHSQEVALIAHAIAVLENNRLSKKHNVERAALLGLYHDVQEILTGDIPTPVKYYNSEIKNAFDKVEEVAVSKLLQMLPNDLKKDYAPLLSKTTEEEEIWKIVKAADKISALIKCIEEEKTGNTEFVKARKTIEKKIEKLNCEGAKMFIEEFIEGYKLTLDQLN